MTFAGFVLLFLAACGGQSNRSDYPSSTYTGLPYLPPDPAETPIQAIPPSRPTHNYFAKEGVFYSYIAAISEDDRKAGRAAGSAITYAYLGRRSGKHVLVRVTADGNPIEEAYCGTPCRVISFPDGTQIAYVEGSVIGSAFADAIAGRLEQATYSWPEQPEPPREQPRPETPVPTPEPQPSPERTPRAPILLDDSDGGGSMFRT